MDNRFQVIEGINRRKILEEEFISEIVVGSLSFSQMQNSFSENEIIKNNTWEKILKRANHLYKLLEVTPLSNAQMEKALKDFSYKNEIIQKYKLKSII